jgi:ATP-dependent helicase/DNAse subunit B
VSFSLYLGPYQPFLEEQLLQSFQAFRQKNPFEKVTVLVPNFLLVGHLRKVLTEKGQNLFNLEVHTLRHYMESIAEEKAVTEDFQNLPDVLVPLVLKEATKSLLSQSRSFGSVSQTPGFYHALRATLSELKEGLYTSESLAVHAARLTKAKQTRLGAKLKEFAGLFKAYEDWKKKGRWLDREDTYFKVLENPVGQGVVWVYGFYDASAVQKKVLRHLSAAGESHWFIPYEDSPVFEYAKPFVQWAKSLGKVQKESRWTPLGKSPRQRLQERLFTDPSMGSAQPKIVARHEASQRAQDTASSDVADVEVASDCQIILCPGEPREAQEVARVLLQEADRQNVFLSDCAVVLRETSTYRKLMPHAFQTEGVPLSKSLPAPLLESTESKALLLLLDGFTGDFSRDTTINLLSCPCLNPEGFELGAQDWNPSSWDVISREARVVEGEQEWIARLLAWREQKQRHNAEEDEDSPASEALKASMAFEKALGRLFNARTQFLKEKGWGGQVSLLKTFLEKFLQISDQRKEVSAVLESLSLLSASFKLNLTSEDLKELLSAMLEQKQSAARQLEKGGAQVVDLMQARGVSFEVAVLPGLVEKFVPRLVRQDPLLLDEERLLITDRGEEQIALKQASALEERMLFLLAVRSAQKSLVLTAPHLNPSTGSPRTPSIYLFESAEAVLNHRVSRLGDVENLVKVVTVNDWVKPDLASCGNPVETLLTSVSRARQGNPESALAVTRDVPFYFEGKELLKNRQALPFFTAYDGMIANAGALTALAENHGLDGSSISASRLETFAACPLRYFYRYVLHLTVYPDPEKILQLQASDRGNLIHDILENTLSRGVKEEWAAQRNVAHGLQVLEEETQKAFRQFEKNGVPGAPGLWHWEKEEMTSDLQGVIKDVLTDPDWTPFAFEVAFGEKGKEVAFELDNGQKLKLQGRMDRVDLSADGQALRVVDYKTGTSSQSTKNSVKAGTKLQLPFYLWALRHLYPEKISKQALYDFMTRRGDYKKVAFDPEAVGDVKPILNQVLTTVADGVAQGLFPSVGTACDHCDYRKLCGTGMEDRGKRKKDDQKVKAYYQLEELP